MRTSVAFRWSEPKVGATPMSYTIRNQGKPLATVRAAGPLVGSILSPH
jgi:hypothetical protein